MRTAGCMFTAGPALTDYRFEHGIHWMPACMPVRSLARNPGLHSPHILKPLTTRRTNAYMS